MKGTLPGGAHNQAKIRIATVVAFICLKAFAMNERLKEKDAYDIHFCLRHCEGGPKGLAAAFLPLLGEPLINEALKILKTKLSSIEMIGPQWASQVADENGDDLQSVARDAYERMQLLLSTVSGSRTG